MALALSAVQPMALSPAAAIDSSVIESLPDLAPIRVKIKAKDYQSALVDLRKYAETHQHADIYNLLGFCLRKTGDYANALTYYKKALDFDPAHKGAHEYLGELYVETGQLPKAKEHLVILERLCPNGCEEREDLQKAVEAATATAPKS